MSLASAYDQYKATVRAEESAKQSNAEKEAPRMAREATDGRENPIVYMLISAGYMQQGGRLVKRTLAAMLANNPSPLSLMNLIQFYSRAAIVEALLA